MTLADQDAPVISPLARVRLRSRNSWDDDERARRRRTGVRVGVDQGSLPGCLPARVQPEWPRTRLCIPERQRSVLHMC